MVERCVVYVFADPYNVSSHIVSNVSYVVARVLATGHGQSLVAVARVRPAQSRL